jgi:NAD(P)-dependent dehydrogenase (short-subunit alcohol dehydrogenase family)
VSTSTDADSRDNLHDLSGQVALVTGGGRGIGRVIALSLAAAGAAVAVMARSADELRDTAAGIEAAGGRALAVAADVTDRRAVERAVQTVEQEFGRVDLLVNNAGIGGPIGPLWEVDPDEWWSTMDINLRGVLLCTRAVLPGMVARRYGRIINVASQAGAHRWPLVSAYATSKAAVIKFTENLAAEARREGVAVFAIHPGTVITGPTAAVLRDEVPPDSHAGRIAAWFRQQVADGHAVPPECAGHLVVALASGRADALSGRYVSVYDDVHAWIDRGEEIRRDDLYRLRLHERA